MDIFNPSVYDFINKYIPEQNIYLRESMKNHTTFRVGGEAAYLLRPVDEEGLREVISFFKEENIPFFVKGNGSNILVGDNGYYGAIIEISHTMNEIKVDSDIIKTGAGALMSAISSEALKHSLTGMEFASGIPGTIGGGVTMNAGAYGGELKDIVTAVRVLDAEGNAYTLSNEDMKFGYRTSILKSGQYVVTEVTIRLNSGDAETIRASMEDLNTRRREKQPLEYPSAGSTFKRPEGYFAGKLIEDAGLRGFTIGGAQVSEKHCGFVINKKDATAKDIRTLIEHIQRTVSEKEGVLLEPEVIFLGDF